MSADPEEVPLPRGAYNINWDEIDENVNPFVTRSKVTGSPPPGASPDEVPLPPPPSALDINGAAAATLSSFGPDQNSPASLKDCSNKSAAQRPVKKAPIGGPPKKKRPTAALTEEKPKKAPSESSGLRDRIREMKRQQRLQQEECDRGLASLADRRPSQEAALCVEPPPVGDATEAPVSPLPPPPPPAPPRFASAEDEEDLVPPPPPPAAVGEDEEVSVKLMKPPPPMPPPRAPTTTVSSRPKEPPLPPPPPPMPMEEEFRPADEAFRADFLDALEKKTLLQSQATHDVPRESVIVRFDPLLKNSSPAVSIPAGDAGTENASCSPALPPPPEELLEPYGDLPPPPKREDFENDGPIAPDDSEPNLMGTPQRNSESVLANPVVAATAEVDRILAFSPASPSLPRRGLLPVTPATNRRLDFEDEKEAAMKFSDADLERLRQEIEMSFQAQLLEKERQWDERLRGEQTEKERLEEQCSSYLKDCEEMKICVIEYEKTLQDFLAQKSNSETVSKDSVEKIMRERDQAIEDTDTIERAFNDLHRRYDKSKQVIEAIKVNEETLKKCLEESQLKLKRQAQKYQTLKTHAEERLEHASREIEKTRKAHEAELLKVQSALKKAELQVKGLEAQVEQKVKENDELTKICDELIAKCGR